MPVAFRRGWGAGLLLACVIAIAPHALATNDCSNDTDCMDQNTECLTFRCVEMTGDPGNPDLGSPALGPANAAVTVVAFSDFQ